MRSATRACSSKKQRVRVRLAGRLVREYGDRPTYVASTRGQRGAVDAIVAAASELDALKDINDFGRRAKRRFEEFAGLPAAARPAPADDAKRPARPAVADAAAAFASAGLDATDAVDDCLACWEFLCAFRGSAVLPLNSEAGHLMLPETRLDEFAAALQAPHAELQRRPAHANQYRYLQHLHVELLKVLFNDDGTDAWWPKPAKRHAGPESNLRLRCARIVSTRLLISVENWTRAIDSSQNQPNRLRFDRAREFSSLVPTSQLTG